MAKNAAVLPLHQSAILPSCFGSGRNRKKQNIEKTCMSASCAAYTTNMKKLKHYTIAGAIFVLIVGTLSHFIYEWLGQNFIIGFFFPVNESTWEHMKICFFPMLIYSLFMSKRLKNDYPCVTSSLLLGTLFGTFLIPVIFYTYTGILGKNYLALDIATFILSVIFAFAAVYKFTLSCKAASCALLLKQFVLIIAVCFFVFTYLPPDMGLFISPTE
ncbi:MAG: DUF6512 family protein [Roseburia sp.]